MRNVRIKEEGFLFSEGVYCFSIQVKVCVLWVTIQQVKDEDEDYAHSRAEEIVSYIKNEE